MLASSVYLNRTPEEEKWDCPTLAFPMTNATGRWGIGRFKSILNWLFLMPILTLMASMIIWRKRVKVIVSIAHGHFFIVAALVSIITAAPLILIVHDDWVAGSCRNSYILKYFAFSFFKWVARTAAYIYAVSPYMQTHLKTVYGVSAELQMPAIEPPPHNTDSLRCVTTSNPNSPIKIVYAGLITSAMVDSLELLIRLVNEDTLARYGLTAWSLHLYVKDIPAIVKQYGGLNQRIFVHGWAPQTELGAALSTADILFLPFSFREEEKFATTRAFPSKTANYLAAQRPILICAPPDSSLVKYARQNGFAEVVDEPNQERLAEAIARICTSPPYTAALLERTQAVLYQNHNIDKQRTDFLKLVKQLASHEKIFSHSKATQTS